MTYIKQLIYNPKYRAILYQVLISSVIILLAYFMISHLFTNIEKRGITTGFDFLSSTAGFDILFTLIDYTPSDNMLRVFLVGLINTLLVSVLAITFASIIGLIVGIARLSDNYLVSKISLIYIDLFRNIPILLQILFWYGIILNTLPSPKESIEFFDVIFLNIRGLYLPKPILQDNSIWILVSFIMAIISVIILAKWSKKRLELEGRPFAIISTSISILALLPIATYLLVDNTITFEISSLQGFNFDGGLTIIPELLALTIALSVYPATYIAEAIRSGIASVPKGQKEAAISIGLSKNIVMRKIILPQALRVAIPPILNQYLNLIKNSSLATAIGYPEVVTIFAGTALNQTGQAIEIILMTMGVYLTFSIVLSVVLNWFNKKIMIKER